MAQTQPSELSEIGMVGLGVMGRSFLLNMADHGFAVSGFDKDLDKVKALREETGDRAIRTAETMEEFVDQLHPPQAVMMLVPSGAPVDSVLSDLLAHLQPGAVIIDGGNSYFKDTELRQQRLKEKGFHLLGVGVSGGEKGARNGPSIMPGGAPEAYARVQPILEAAAAKAGDEPCVAWLGPRSAGHFIKMIHNGIEYAVMQLIAEVYDLLKRVAGFDDDQLHDVFLRWNEGELRGYLMEITANIFRRKDEVTGKRLIDEVLDIARQKGTGMWTSQSAMELEVPTPTIDLAVAMRNMSLLEKERADAESVYTRPIQKLESSPQELVEQLEGALLTGMIVAYAQGFAVLAAASRKYRYDLKLETVARIWRGGCIIRAALLDDIRAAFQRQPNLANLLLDDGLAKKVAAGQEALRRTVCFAAQSGVPAPGMMTALGYLDSYRSGVLPANLIQAQRDYFGAHTYERIDRKGTFHTEWEKGLADADQ